MLRKTALCATALLVLGVFPASADPSRTITLPLFGSVNATIDWGAQNANRICQRIVTTPGEVSCVYPLSDGRGPFPVRISGTVTQFGNGEAGYSNAENIKEVTQFGNIGLESLSGAFNGAVRMTGVAADLPESVSDISYMFLNAVNIDDSSISDWGLRTRNITNVEGAFENAVELSRDLTLWCMRNIDARPERFRRNTLNTDSTLQQRILGKLRAARMRSEMQLTEEKEPRWGKCGIDMQQLPAQTIQAGSGFSIDMKDGVTYWPNVPEPDPSKLRFSVVSGTLPPGLELNEITGEITGTPTQPGTFNFKVQAIQLDG